jgi:cellulose synthase/poly-beta-1,6-N-acetylglucosamine synthase-like glycosyltransferase
VTEDADIGIRLARFGGVAGTISPPTLEEAPSGFGAWLNQRTRWMKGHLQTWLVLNRRPLRAMADLGLANFLAIQLTLGGSLLASMLHGPLFVWIAADIFVAGNLELWHFGLLGLGYASAVAAAFVSGAVKTGWRSLLLLPLYWPLQSLAMLKALWEIKTRPHFWAKTSHGKARPAARPPLLLPDLRQPVPDNLTQLELPFAPAEDAATLPLGGRM